MAPTSDTQEPVAPIATLDLNQDQFQRLGSTPQTSFFPDNAAIQVSLSNDLVGPGEIWRARFVLTHVVLERRIV